MFHLFTSPQRQLDAARTVLARLAELVNARFSIELWDGSRVPLGKDVNPHLYVSVQGPGVIGALLRWPTLDNLVRHYATGQIEIHGGTFVEFMEAARVEKSRSRMRRLPTGLLIQSALPFFFAPAEKLEPQHAFAGDQIGRKDSTQRRNQDYIQFHYDLGNDFYQLFLDPEMQYSCGYKTDRGRHALEVLASLAATADQHARDFLADLAALLPLAPQAG
jgi:cyclopropane-fatty-acyl-phospholipid synthase